MIQEIRSIASPPPSVTSGGSALEQQVQQLFDASRTLAGAIDTRMLAANVLGASGGDGQAIGQLSQAVSAQLSPVDQGAFSNFLEDLLETIRGIIDNIMGGGTPPAEGNTPPQGVTLPPRASDSASIPGLEAIASDPVVSSAIEASWNASNPNTPGAKQETGFWVVRDTATGQLSTVAFPSNGTRDSLTPGPVPNIPGKEVVAFFHTHPNTTAEGYVSGPSPADLNFAKATGIPGIVRSHDGMYYFNPPS